MQIADSAKANGSAQLQLVERGDQYAQHNEGVPTEELEQRLVEAVLSMEATGRLPGPLHNSVRRYRQIQRELQTHMRGPLLLSRDEYAEVGACCAVLRSQIVDLCLQAGMFL